MTEVTRILSQIAEGDPVAARKLLPLVHDELRKMAAARLVQEKPGQTLQATALVHEAYLRLVGRQDKGITFESRKHLFGAAAEARRRILVDQARRKMSIRGAAAINEWSICPTYQTGSTKQIRPWRVSNNNGLMLQADAPLLR